MFLVSEWWVVCFDLFWGVFLSSRMPVSLLCFDSCLVCQDSVSMLSAFKVMSCVCFLAHYFVHLDWVAD